MYIIFVCSDIDKTKLLKIEVAIEHLSMTRLQIV